MCYLQLCKDDIIQKEPEIYNIHYTMIVYNLFEQQ